METVDRNKIRREPGECGSLVKVISMEHVSAFITTGPYNVTGGANVEIAFVLLQDGSFFYFI